ncbi:MAG: hypothetical protein K6L60_14870 [Oceanobacter sp.]
MKDTITCYRPLGQAELDLVAASGYYNYREHLFNRRPDNFLVKNHHKGSN